MLRDLTGAERIFIVLLLIGAILIVVAAGHFWGIFGAIGAAGVCVYVSAVTSS